MAVLKIQVVIKTSCMNRLFLFNHTFKYYILKMIDEECCHFRIIVRLKVRLDGLRGLFPT